MADLVLRRARVADDAELVDIAVTDGIITAVEPDLRGPAATEIDCAARVVIPGLIEPHVHLDKALLDTQATAPDNTLAGAIAITGELKRGFTAADVAARARKVLDLEIGRAHV